MAPHLLVALKPLLRLQERAPIWVPVPPRHVAPPNRLWLSMLKPLHVRKCMYEMPVCVNACVHAFVYMRVRLPKCFCAYVGASGRVHLCVASCMNAAAHAPAVTL